MGFRVKSKSKGSYFGTYATRKSAEMDAEDANEKAKFTLKDWEVEEKPEAPMKSKNLFGGESFQRHDGKWGISVHGQAVEGGPFGSKEEADAYIKKAIEAPRSADAENILKDGEAMPTPDEVDMALKTLTKALKGKRR